MKSLKILSFLFAAALLTLTSCSKEDEFTSMVGTWETSDGGEVTFRADGTGTNNGCDYFQSDVSNEFEYYMIEMEEGQQLNEYTLQLEYQKENTHQYMTFPLNVKSDKKVKVGEPFFMGEIVLKRK